MVTGYGTHPAHPTGQGHTLRPSAPRTPPVLATSQSSLLRDGIARGSVAPAGLFRTFPAPLRGETLPFRLRSPTVMVSAWRGGLDKVGHHAGRRLL